ncbi:MAG: hypothetical protein KAH86_10670, partial [Methanosarcinales archaeon]|nr:hypothetical protein [Methanosarcinales archaeon]
ILIAMPADKGREQADQLLMHRHKIDYTKMTSCRRTGWQKQSPQYYPIGCRVIKKSVRSDDDCRTWARGTISIIYSNIAVAMYCRIDDTARYMCRMLSPMV